MGFTLYYSTKKIEEWKKRQEYKAALDYLETIVKKHSMKAGFLAWFKNERPFLDMLDELRSLRITQCIEKAKGCIVDKTDPLKEKDKPFIDASLVYYEEAKLLLAEAEAIKSTSEARILLKTADRAIHVIHSHSNGGRALREKCLQTARKHFLEIKDIHPAASEYLIEIDNILGSCRDLKQIIPQDISKRDFPAARKGLDELFNMNREDEDHAKWLQEIHDKETADKLISSAKSGSNRDDAESLYTALKKVIAAKRLDPNYDEIATLERDIRDKIAAIKYREGIHFRDKEKDIDKAIASFKEIETLGLPYKESHFILNELVTVKGKIAAFYNQGVSHGRDLEKALAQFKKAQALGFCYEDLNKRLEACERDLRKCNDLISGAEAELGQVRGDYDRAIEKIQEALLLYPTYKRALDLLQTAQTRKRFQDHLNKARGHFEGKDFRFREALSEVDEALAIEAENTEALGLRRDIRERTLEWLMVQVGKLADDQNKLTTAIKLIRSVSEHIPLSNQVEAILRALESKEAEARRYYQDGFSFLNKARAIDITQEGRRESLYAEAERLFGDAVSKNADLKDTIDPEKTKLEKETEEWEAYVEARGLFEKGEYKECLNRLSPYKERPALEEISDLTVAALNKLGFSGSFKLRVEDFTYVIIPEDTVFVGRNTAAFKENHIALKLKDISRKHGQITRLGDRFYYEDRKGCTHGTKVNGKMIDRQIELKDRDVLGYGFFREEDGYLTNGDPVSRLRMTVYPSTGEPTLKITCEPSDHEEFCEDTCSIYILMGDGITIGRKKSNTIAVKDASAAPEHMRISCENRRYYIKDLGSPGGSFVNDEPLTDKRTLQLGDRIKMGNLEMEVEAVD